MEQLCTVANHLSIEEIDERILRARESWRARRWLVIRHALVDPQPPATIAARFGLAPQTVRNLLWAYKQRGSCGRGHPGAWAAAAGVPQLRGGASVAGTV